MIVVSGFTNTKKQRKVLVVEKEKEEFVKCLPYNEVQHGAWKDIPKYPSCIEHVHINDNQSNRHQVCISWDPEVPEETVVPTEPVPTKIVAVEDAVVSTQSSPQKRKSTMAQWLNGFWSNHSDDDDTARQPRVRKPQARKRQLSSDDDEASSIKVRKKLKMQVSSDDDGASSPKVSEDDDGASSPKVRKVSEDDDGTSINGDAASRAHLRNIRTQTYQTDWIPDPTGSVQMIANASRWPRTH